MTPRIRAIIAAIILAIPKIVGLFWSQTLVWSVVFEFRVSFLWETGQ